MDRNILTSMPGSSSSCRNMDDGKWLCLVFGDKYCSNIYQSSFFSKLDDV